MPRATLETEEVHLMVNEVQGKVVQVCHGEHLIGGEEGGEVAAQAGTGSDLPSSSYAQEVVHQLPLVDQGA